MASSQDIKMAREVIKSMDWGSRGMILTPGGCWVTRPYTIEEEELKKAAQETLRDRKPFGVWARCEAWLLNKEARSENELGKSMRQGL